MAARHAGYIPAITLTAIATSIASIITFNVSTGEKDMPEEELDAVGPDAATNVPPPPPKPLLPPEERKPPDGAAAELVVLGAEEACPNTAERP